jgi:hypothetical protein
MYTELEADNRSMLALGEKSDFGVLRSRFMDSIQKSLKEALDAGRFEYALEHSDMILLLTGKKPRHKVAMESYMRKNGCILLSFNDGTRREYYYPAALQPALTSLFSASSPTAIPVYLATEDMTTEFCLERSKISEVKELHPDGTSDELSCNVCMDKSGYYACGNRDCAALLCWSCSNAWYSASNLCPHCRRENFPLSFRII